MKLTNLLLATAMVLSVAAQYKEESTQESFFIQSPDINLWSTNGRVSACIGFIIFGVMFIFTIINIFIDIDKRGKMYASYIEDDLKLMNDMGLKDKMEDFNAELAVRLKGTKTADEVDDQLI